MVSPYGVDQEQVRAEVDRSLEQMERESSAFFGRLLRRWAIRWTIGFALIFLLTRAVDWLDWLWWVAVPIAVLSLLVPLLFRHFLTRRLAKARAQMGGMGAGGTTIDGAWRETTGNARYDRPPAADVIIDQRPPDKRED